MGVRSASETNQYVPVPTQQDILLLEVQDTIKEIVRSRPSNGIAISALATAYLERTGEPIPLYDLGYESIYRLLWEIPEIQSSRGKNGEPRTIWRPSNESRGSFYSSSNNNNRRSAGVGADSNNNRGRNKQRALSGASSEINGGNAPNNRRSRDASWGRKSTSSRSTSRPRYAASTASGGMSDEYYTESEYSKTGSVPELDTRPFIIENHNIDLKKRLVYEPQIGGTQLIGDDYFLQLSMKYCKDAEFYRKDRYSGITCGMVKSGQSIREATKRLQKVTAMSNKLTICLGSVDIYENREAEQLIDDYEQLLMTLQERYQYSPSSITLCAIPQLPNVSLHELERLRNLNEFNNWLQDYSEKHGYKFIDFANEYLDYNLRIKFDMYQEKARLVSGCKHPYILWNYPGRQIAVKLLLDTDPPVPILIHSSSESFSSNTSW